MCGCNIFDRAPEGVLVQLGQCHCLARLHKLTRWVSRTGIITSYLTLRYVVGRGFLNSNPCFRRSNGESLQSNSSGVARIQPECPIVVRSSESCIYFRSHNPDFTFCHDDVDGVSFQLKQSLARLRPWHSPRAIHPDVIVPIHLDANIDVNWHRPWWTVESSTTWNSVCFDNCCSLPLRLSSGRTSSQKDEANDQPGNSSVHGLCLVAVALYRAILTPTTHRARLLRDAGLRVGPSRAFSQR